MGSSEPRRAVSSPSPRLLAAQPGVGGGCGPSFRAPFPGRCLPRSTPEALLLGRGRSGWSQSLSWAFPRVQGHEVTLGGRVLPLLEELRQQVAKGGPRAGVAGAEPFPAAGSAQDQAWGQGRQGTPQC